MKVDVLQAKDVSFKWYQYWSDWVDIAVFNYGGYGYLLQMIVSRTNAKKFKCVAMKSIINTAHAATINSEALTQMSGNHDNSKT